MFFDGGMDPVHISGLWTRSKMGGPWTPASCYVLTSWGSRVLISIPRKIGSPFLDVTHSQNMSNNTSSLVGVVCCLRGKGAISI